MSNRTLVTIRSTLRGAIITKSLRLPASDASKGAAITLISTELEAMELGILRIHSHIVGFFEFVVAIYSLHFFVGYLGNLLLIPILCKFELLGNIIVLTSILRWCFLVYKSQLARCNRTISLDKEA